MNTQQAPITSATVLGIQPSFGFGDRTGMATPGHVAAMQRRGTGIAPVFPQQSIREMVRTGRSPEEVMKDAIQGMIASHWTGDTGADADHLKSHQDVDITAAAGFTWFTIDPSDHVDDKADTYDENSLRQQFGKIRDQIDWFDLYLGQQITLDTGTTIVLDELACLCCAVKYGLALQHAMELSNYIAEVQTKHQRDYEIELSVDETEQPTTLAEHWIIADQSLRHDIKLVSLAPRFVGHFEKGVDYLGDVALLEQSLQDHAAIARQLGPYKLSLHSGSDKLSMYPALARATRGCFHVKTAGTSYLEALRVVALCDASLFRQICNFACSHYNEDRATYHVHATLDNVASPHDLPRDEQLRKVYLENWEDVPNGKGFTEAGRQILHCTFGSVLTEPSLGTAVKQCLRENPDAYTEVLAEHFAKHLDALQTG